MEYVESDFDPLVITAPGVTGTMVFDPMDITGRTAERQAADAKKKTLLMFAALLGVGVFLYSKAK